jgi:hypothetical protein
MTAFRKRINIYAFILFTYLIKINSSRPRKAAKIVSRKFFFAGKKKFGRSFSQNELKEIQIRAISGGKMKLKVLTVFGSAVFLVAGCGGGGANNANTNANANANRANTAVVTSTAAPAADPAVKAAVESALRAKGFNDVSVEATSAGVTLRGTIEKGKLAEAVQAAQEAGKRPVKNELTEK